MSLDEQITLLKGIHETVSLILERTLVERGEMLPQNPNVCVRVDPTNLSVTRNGISAAPLTAKEFQIFSILDQSDHRSVTREVLLATIWRSIKVSPKTLDVHIFNLRRKLSPLGLEIFFRSPNLYQLHVSSDENLRAG